MKKVLVANRGEIATRIFRACSELGLTTVAVYAEEDRFSVHRFKADEAYLIGAGKKPIEAYLDIEEILRVAKMSGADSIHPGYGLLSENIAFARACEKAGLKFVGPKVQHLDMFGDKIKAKLAAEKAGLSGIPGTNGPVETLEEVYAFGEEFGYPVMIKATLGGGGRGMRVAHNKEEVAESFNRAKGEAKAAFGEDEVYVEKYLQDPKHIEVQILGDEQGNVLHLFERDCSIQRRHQKVVEMAPAFALKESLREEICQAALTLMSSVGYVNAGTVEFLLEGENFYFIEVNPRVQVEHTITEMITGIDIVESQLLIAQGQDLFKDLHLPTQEELKTRGYAIQCRITTEDPMNNFLPDTGKLITYRSPGGFGIRLDVGNAYAGAEVSPFFDSLLVKVTVFGQSFADTVKKAKRALREFRIRGVKTNIPFLENVLNHPTFMTGLAKTTFIDDTPELFIFSPLRDRGNKTLQYLGEVTVNGFPGVEKEEKKFYPQPRLPQVIEKQRIKTPKDIFDETGVKGLQTFIKEEKSVLLTDTTMRDAHQSLLATRLRRKDLLPIASIIGEGLPQLFSCEMWGGATFDVSYRFLHEDPWERLKKLRKAMPHTLLQMLFRGANGVGYQNYPDNVLQKFIQEAALSGIDVFRIFDALNWVEQMIPSIEAVKEAGKIAEAAICYTGDINDPKRDKYSLGYYVNLAKDLEKHGADILAIKDMAGILKPQAATRLIKALKEEISLPIHLHTHDTSGNGIMTYANAIAAGVDIVDVAFSPLSGGTSQPSISSLYYALENAPQQPKIAIKNVEKINHYYEDIRPFYHAFDNGLQFPHTEVYQHEMPGGQFSNLQQQAKAVGLLERFDEVVAMYQTVNQLFGDIVKVTPTSKVVGDMALFMVQNQLDEKSLFIRGKELSFPASVVNFFKGDLGQVPGGFPKDLQALILKGEKPITVRPGSLKKPVDFALVKQELAEKIQREVTEAEVLSYLMYPDVFLQYVEKLKVTDNLALLDTPTFFYGMRVGESLEVNIEKGKTLMIRLDEIGQADDEGFRILYYNLNGQRREIKVKDQSIQVTTVKKKKAEPTDPYQIGASMPGSILSVLVKKGETVEKGHVLLVTEAMKMETSLKAPVAGVIEKIYVKPGEIIEAQDLLIKIKD